MLIASMWDDGLASDLRLMDILRVLGLPAAFAISPARHKKERVLNDARGPYGRLVSLSELHEFADFEIVNHTANHVDLGKADPDTTRTEIEDGRKMLEDIFQRTVDGFCYPYGVHTQAALDTLRAGKYQYARTTHSGGSEPLLLKPTARWNGLGELPDRVIFWGHTFELQSEEDWHSLRDLYERLSERPDVRFVTFKELVG